MLRAFAIAALALTAHVSTPPMAMGKPPTFSDLTNPRIPLIGSYCVGIACRYERLSNESARDVFCYGEICQFDRFIYTKAFITAPEFTGYCTGIGCSPSVRYALARRAALDDPAIVGYLISRWSQASRAGQMYIALVVRVHDRGKGEALLQQLAALKDELIGATFGCVGDVRRLSEFAQSYIDKPDFRFDSRL